MTRSFSSDWEKAPSTHTSSRILLYCVCLCVYTCLCIQGTWPSVSKMGYFVRFCFTTTSLEEVRVLQQKNKNKERARKKAQPQEQIKPNSAEISQHKHGHLQMMNKRRDYERQSSSMPSSNGSRNPEVHLIFAAVCVCYLQKGGFTCRQPRSGCA